MKSKSPRYPRGKSWNWYKRALKRGDFRATLWLELRRAKHELMVDLFHQVVGTGIAQFNGLEGIL